jgi:predicted nucleic acid-binding protein
MAASAIVDASFLIALLGRRDNHGSWAAAQALRFSRPWKTCDAALSEAFHLLDTQGFDRLAALLRRGSVVSAFSLAENVEPVLALMEKYADVPMSFADACLVRMTELLPDPILLTTDSDFRFYRRHSRRTVPCATPD